MIIVSLSIFWVSVFWLLYVYIGYPLCLEILIRIKKFRKTRIIRDDFIPSVTVLISAYNESRCIESTVLNKFNISYNGDIEVIVISDCSTDDTDKIVEKLSNKNPKIKLVSLAELHCESDISSNNSNNFGKTVALNEGIKYANGDIIIFSDANSIYADKAINYLVSNLADPEVGYVTGNMQYKTKESKIGRGYTSYMEYENKLRDLETQLGSIVGVNGGIDAMRRSDYMKLAPHQQPDFVQPLMMVESGKRVVYEPAAVLYEDARKEPKEELRMRRRVALRAYYALRDMSSLLYGKAGWLFAWQLWSHKFLRYLCFIPLVGIYVSSLILQQYSQQGFYDFAVLIQSALFCLALGHALLIRQNIRLKFFEILYYFILLNVASGTAFIDFLLGKTQDTWQSGR